MTYLVEILSATLRVFVQMSPYLLLGLALSGLLYAVAPMESVARWLGRKSRWGPVWAAMAGTPLPLCSCGVLPFAGVLRDRGASPGSIISFLISTPQTGVDSVLISASMLGWPLALWKVAAAFVSGVIAGFAAAFSGARFPESPCPCGCGKIKSGSEEDCACAGEHSEPAGRWPARLRAGLVYAAVTNLGAIAPWLVMGLFAAGIVAGLVPENLFSRQAFPKWLEMPVVLAIALPLYLCTSGSVPLAAALAAKGLSMGAVMVLLTAGPATSAVSLAVLTKTLGRRLVAVYAISIVLLSVISGLAFNAFFPEPWPGLREVLTCHAETLPWWNWASAALLAALLLWHLARWLFRRAGGLGGKSSAQTTTAAPSAP